MMMDTPIRLPWGAIPRAQAGVVPLTWRGTCGDGQPIGMERTRQREKRTPRGLHPGNNA